MRVDRDHTTWTIEPWRLAKRKPIVIKRGEPDAALLRVPADYDTSPGHSGRQRPPPPAASG